MLRFAVHQLDQRRASPRSHGTPCREVPRRVHISIAGVRADHAAEESLALATPRSDMPTHRTTLTRERGIDSFDPASSFVLQASGECRPGGVEDGPIETSFLRHVAPGLIDSAPSRADHVRHSQVLDPDHVILAGDDRRGLLHEILPPIRCTRTQPCQPRLRPSTPAGAALAPRQRACRLPDAQRRRRLVGGAVGQSQRHGDTTIDTHDRAVSRTVQRHGDHRERDVPTPRSIQSDPIGLPASQGTATPESHPADLGHQDPRPAPVDLLHPQSSRTDDTKTLMPAPLAPLRPSVTTTPPIRHGLRKVPQRLLLHRLRTRTQPLIRSTSLSQLPALHHIVRKTLPMMPIPQLLHREIPHEPSLRTVRREQLFLLRCRIQAKPHSWKLAERPDNSGFLPALAAGTSTRDLR